MRRVICTDSIDPQSASIRIDLIEHEIFEIEFGFGFGYIIETQIDFWSSSDFAFIKTEIEYDPKPENPN